MAVTGKTLASINKFFAKGVLGKTGLQITSLSTVEVQGQFEVKPALHQPAGILNGGVSLLVAESIATVAANHAADDTLGDKGNCVGVQVTCNHLEAVKSGKVRVVGRPLKVGLRTQVWQVQCFRADGRMSCSVQLTFLNIGNLRS